MKKVINLLLTLVFSLSLFGISSLLPTTTVAAQETGSISGYVYQSDETTPN